MTAPLRVAVLARSVFPLHGVGGLERHVYDLVRHLTETGTQVTLITKEPTANAPVAEDVLRNISLRTVPYTTFPFAGRRWTTILDRDTAYPLFGERAGRLAAELVRDGSIDIVHGFGASALGYARRRAALRAPLVLNPQGLEEFGATDPAQARLKRAAYLPLRRAVLTCARAADRVIATDRALEPAVLEHLEVPRDKVRLVPNAIDLDEIDRLSRRADPESVRAAAGLTRDDVVLLSVGRLEANKGFHVLADALGALRAHGAPLRGNWQWVLIGDGPHRGAIQQAVAAAQLDGHVQLRGRISDEELHAWYETATVFVHPTLYEGSSLVTLEAMAHQRAVVATRAGGLPDKVRHNETGWLVEPGRPDQLAAAISGALARPERLPDMGRAGRVLVEQEFAWPAVTKRLLDVYRELQTTR